MDQEEIKETDVWVLFTQAQDYARKMGMYEQTDLNFRMYNDDQWNGVKLQGVEPVQLNFLKPIVNYKVGALSQNLWAIHYSSENYDNKEFLPYATKVCELLNKRADKIWEKEYMDFKIRTILKNAAIVSEAPIYINYDKDSKMPIIEGLSKNDIYFGNENDSEIQTQPYILIKKRLPVSSAKELAQKYGAKQKEIDYIIGDNENLEEAGDLAKEEKDNMVTVVWKFWKKDKKVFYSIATRYCEILKDKNSQLSLYPITHMLWEEKEGSARGSAEITKGLVSNQIEVNKIVMRRVVVSSNTAFPQKVVNIDKVVNKSAINEVGGIIEVQGQDAEDVKKYFTHIQPAQMSSDVEKLEQDLIQVSRELANASQAASGDINAEEASGKAILAVQQASQQPLVEQLSMLKRTIEDIARIILDMIKTYSSDGLQLEEEIEDETTGEKTIEVIDVPGYVLDELRASVKVDITPKSAYDKYAQERSIENLFVKGMFNPQMLSQLKFYLECLDDDSVMPKQRILERVNKELDKQRRIAEMQAKAQQLMTEQNQFLNSNDPDAQATQIMKNKLIERIRQAAQQKINGKQIQDTAQNIQNEEQDVLEEQVIQAQ